MIKKILTLAMSLTMVGCSPTDEDNKLVSPDSKVAVTVELSDKGALTYSVKREGVTILNESSLGVILKNATIGNNVKLDGKAVRTTVDESYAWTGNKSELRNHYNSLSFPVKSIATSHKMTVEFRAFNDGVAFRYVVANNKKTLVTGELTSFNTPAGSQAWYRINQPQYEKLASKAAITDIEKGFNMQMPLTIELADSKGFVAITEGGSFLYSGMSLVAHGTDELTAKFAGDRRGFSIEGTITTPWRIVMTGPTPNDLANCDIVYNVCPQPDEKLFPQGKKTSWIKPGRSLWNWWAYGKKGVQWEAQKKMVDQAAEMKCEYYLIDDGWEMYQFGWYKKGEDETRWDRLKELVDYAATKGVGILVWRPWKSGTYKDGETRYGVESVEKMEEFFSNLSKAGVKGAKVDFLASEGVSRRKFCIDVLSIAAKHKIMINFHGCPKPTGEAKTWPNEVSREGIFGLEHQRIGPYQLPVEHYCLVPFIRNLAGHGDFTPVTFQKNKLFGTTFSLQLAMAIVENSSVKCWADFPHIYLESPALTFIHTIPATWDETIYLPDTKIGKFVVLARRTGKDWYLAVMNSDDKNGKSYEVDLSFLGEGNYNATYSRDNMNRADALVIEDNVKVTKATKIKIDMLSGGGFVGRFIRTAK